MTQRHLVRGTYLRFDVCKCFGLPGRIELYEQHFPRLGGAAAEVDPERVMRFNHYRRDIYDERVADASMAVYSEAIGAEIRRAFGPDLPPGLRNLRVAR